MVSVLLPHLLGSIVNISYNALRIVGNLNAEQQAVFNQLVLYYNVLVYPVCLYVLYRIIVPIQRTWRALDGPAVPTDEQVKVTRGKVMRLPVWAIGIACAGWLPGGLLFPIVIDATAGPLDPHVFGHFVVSFFISGLIALTYSLFAIQYWGLRVLYPRLWVDAHHLREQAAAELVTLPAPPARLSNTGRHHPARRRHHDDRGRAGAVQPDRLCRLPHPGDRPHRHGHDGLQRRPHREQAIARDAHDLDRQRSPSGTSASRSFAAPGKRRWSSANAPARPADSNALRSNNISNLSNLPSEIGEPPQGGAGGTG